jgi:hypothetical protein
MQAWGNAPGIPHAEKSALKARFINKLLSRAFSAVAV